MKLTAVTTTAHAQGYPAKPVRLVVGYAPGGGQDQVARLLGQGLAERLGQQVLIENRPGSATTLATEAVVNAPPDGHTLLLVAAATVMSPNLYARLRFDLQRDIAPVWGLIRETSVLVVPPGLPATTLAELVAYAKANPGKINMGSSGVGSIAHVAGELFKLRTGTDMVHVPYRGTSQAMIDLLTGRAQVMFSSLAGAIGHIRQGKLRPLGVTTARRSTALPDVPAIGEAIDGYEASGMVGIGAPKGTPGDIIETLNRHLSEVVMQPNAKARFDDLGSVASQLSPAEFGQFIGREIERWKAVIRAADIKPE